MKDSSRRELAHVFDTGRIFSKLLSVFLGERLRFRAASRRERSCAGRDEACRSFIFQSQTRGNVTAHRVADDVIAVHFESVNESLRVSDAVLDGMISGIIGIAETGLVDRVDCKAGGSE